MSKLKIAIQKSGRLSEKSLELFKQCGINIANGDRKLKAEAKNFPLEILFLRDDDIPQYVEQKVADLGIVGENVVLENNKQLTTIKKLDFAHCRLSLAVPKNVEYEGVQFFNGKKIATSYPVIIEQYFKEKGVIAEIETISGSVEIAPSIGLADGIADLVSTGSTLISNGLKEVETVLQSQAVLVANKQLTPAENQILEKLLFRLNAVQQAKGFKYILLNAPEQSLPEINRILPGLKSPTVMPLAEKGWVSVHSVIAEDTFWEVIDQLKDAGAQGILICPIEKMFN
ncbi:MAG: ATP phosphoribosyltransferase [Luteibaculaceae bacterium]